jgi:predicted Co/Zn/Cd cation transporter (cation efflux family)
MITIDKIEKRALWVTVFVNSVMAVAGWITYNFTGSQAMLLDGNFSFVLAIATMIAIYISKIKHKKTKTFPFGSYVYEAAFVLSKGLLILGIVIAAFLQNILKIIDFFQGEKEEPILMTPIYFYTVFILILTFSLLVFFKNQNKKINNQSSMLMVEAASAKIDGGLTLATGLVFFLLSFVALDSKIDFLLYIGDSIIVVLLCLVIIRSPLSIIKNAFVELTGGSIQDQKEKQRIEQMIDEVVTGKFQYHNYISKIGSGYLVIIYIEPNTEMINVKDLKRIHKEIKEKLQEFYPSLLVELSLKE